jgi:hypothetical protein
MLMSGSAYDRGRDVGFAPSPLRSARFARLPYEMHAWRKLAFPETRTVEQPASEEQARCFQLCSVRHLT